MAQQQKSLELLDEWFLLPSRFPDRCLAISRQTVQNPNRHFILQVQGARSRKGQTARCSRGILVFIQDGVYIDGLYLDGGRWDIKEDSLVDQVIGKLYFPMPVIHFLPM